VRDKPVLHTIPIHDTAVRTTTRHYGTVPD
jgi:hypothetical protein